MALITDRVDALNVSAEEQGPFSAAAWIAQFVEQVPKLEFEQNLPDFLQLRFLPRESLSVPLPGVTASLRC